MKEERMFILNMLNEGKISSDDACKLLAALKPDAEKTDISEKVGKYAKDLKTKVTKIAKDAEPKVKKYAEAVNGKLEDIKSNLKAKKASDAAEEEIVIVETEEAEAAEEAAEAEIAEAIEEAEEA